MKGRSMNRPFVVLTARPRDIAGNALTPSRAHMKETSPMTAKKFDPAPHDKHADPQTKGKAAHAELDAALAGSFPASDPVSVVQPAPSRETEAEEPSLW